MQPGTTTELNLSDYFRANRMTFKPVVIETLPEVLNAYFSGRCDVFTTDVSGLVSTRGSRAPNPADHIILPEVISKEPLGPAVRHGDDRWFDVVKWSLFATIEAEEMGLDLEEHRSAGEQQGSRRTALRRRDRRHRQDARAGQPLGAATSSSRSATTARASTRTSNRSASSAA